MTLEGKKFNSINHGFNYLLSFLLAELTRYDGKREEEEKRICIAILGKGKEEVQSRDFSLTFLFSLFLSFSSLRLFER
jgi:hypothetical protein